MSHRHLLLDTLYRIFYHVYMYVYFHCGAYPNYGPTDVTLSGKASLWQTPETPNATIKTRMANPSNIGHTGWYAIWVIYKKMSNVLTDTMIKILFLSSAKSS